MCYINTFVALKNKQNTFVKCGFKKIIIIILLNAWDNDFFYLNSLGPEGNIYQLTKKDIIHNIKECFSWQVLFIFQFNSFAKINDYLQSWGCTIKFKKIYLLYV